MRSNLFWNGKELSKLRWRQVRQPTAKATRRIGEENFDSAGERDMAYAQDMPTNGVPFGGHLRRKAQTCTRVATHSPFKS